MLLNRPACACVAQVLLKRFRLPAQKVLLFSYSTTMLDVLQVCIRQGTYLVNYLVDTECTDQIDHDLYHDLDYLVPHPPLW